LWLNLCFFFTPDHLLRSHCRTGCTLQGELTLYIFFSLILFSANPWDDSRSFADFQHRVEVENEILSDARTGTCKMLTAVNLINSLSVKSLVPMLPCWISFPAFLCWLFTPMTICCRWYFGSGSLRSYWGLSRNHQYFTGPSKVYILITSFISPLCDVVHVVIFDLEKISTSAPIFQ